LARLYPESVIARIAKTLQPFKNAEAERNFPRKIRDWVASCLALGHLERNRSNKPARKKQMMRLSRAAKELTAALNHLDHNLQDRLCRALLKVETGKDFGHPLDDSPLWDTAATDEHVSELIGKLKAIESAADQIAIESSPRRGRPKQSMHQVAVDALANIYHEATGRWPTRRYDAFEEQVYGPFYDFCVAALRPIWHTVTAGSVDKLMR
jgi:hypothetical protein